jgi:uncharacterized protein
MRARLSEQSQSSPSSNILLQKNKKIPILSYQGGNGMNRTISTIIIKPTKGCNADCTYCCAPPDDAPKWDITTFKKVFDALEHRLNPAATFIWHGGEPMLLGPEFYREAIAYARTHLPSIRFSIQSNILAYNHRWNDVFKDVFDGSISTSWDPDELCRTYKGSATIYSRLFHSRLNSVLEDGWRPKVISTVSEETVDLAHDVYDRALKSDLEGKTYDIRLNYRYPAGRAEGEGPSLLPSSYARTLIEIYDRWVIDCPDFLVTPLDQMLLKVTGAELARCPWAMGCTGKIIGMEPNYDIYNCGEFADLADEEFRFGNLLTDGIDTCLSSSAAKMLSFRKFKHPESCKSCIHYTECEAGCMRDSALFGRGLYGKFYYCEAWQEIFSRIKESIITGEADRALEKFGHDPEAIKNSTLARTSEGLQRGLTNMRRPLLAQGYIPTFETLNTDPGECDV